MKQLVALGFVLLLSFTLGSQAGVGGQKQSSTDPCSLTSAESLAAIFPTLQQAEKQLVGQQSVCNYLDKMGIPALVISVSQAPADVRKTLSMLGSGYLIEDVDGLGDQAAMAIQQANPKYGLKEGIAALHVKKGKSSLNFSFFRINLMPADPQFEELKLLAAKMVENM